MYSTEDLATRPNQKDCQSCLSQCLNRFSQVYLSPPVFQMSTELILIPTKFQEPSGSKDYGCEKVHSIYLESYLIE